MSSEDDVCWIVSPIDQDPKDGPLRVVGPGRWHPSEKPEHKLHFDRLKKILKKLPRVFTRSITPHVMALAIGEKNPESDKTLERATKYAVIANRSWMKQIRKLAEECPERMIFYQDGVYETKEDSFDRFEVDFTIPGLHTQVLLDQGIHIRYDEYLPKGTIVMEGMASKPLPPYRPPENAPLPQARMAAMQHAIDVLTWLQTSIALNPQCPPTNILQYITQAYSQQQINHVFSYFLQAFPQFCQSFPGFNPVQIAYQALPAGTRVAAPVHTIPQQVPAPQQRAPLAPRPVPQQSVQQAVSLIHQQRRVPLQQSVARPQNSRSPTLTNSSSDDSDEEDEANNKDSQEFDVNVCLGDGDGCLIASLYDALTYPRDNTGDEVKVPSHPGPNDPEEKFFRLDPMLILNRICVWLFLCTHQKKSKNAREVIPKKYKEPKNLPEDLRDNILDVTEISLEMQGLLSSPQSNHNGQDAISSREASAQWQIACGSFKGVSGKDYDNNIKNFVMGLITVAHMSYEDAMKCIRDAVPQSFGPRGRDYTPSPEVHNIVVAFEHTQQTAHFLHHQMSKNFLHACRASDQVMRNSFARGANEFDVRNGLGLGVSLAALAAQFMHSVATNKADLKRVLSTPLIHMSQKRRREEAATQASTSGLREESDDQPSAFTPVVPKANDKENDI